MSQFGYVLIVLLLIGAMVGVALFLPTNSRIDLWVWSWIINLILMFVIVGTISLSVGSKGGFFALFVDDRNMVSLSRFQIILWTLIILSAIWTIILARVGDSISNSAAYTCVNCKAPADLYLQPMLYALMGISITSTVSSALIKENKAHQTIGGQQKYNELLTKTLGASQNKNEFSNIGAIAVREQDIRPRFSDMFRGEETGNLVYLDISKVQNFFFTVVAAISYAIAIAVALIGAESISAIEQLPTLSEGLLVILGISHVGYLVNKAAVTPPPSP